MSRLALAATIAVLAAASPGIAATVDAQVRDPAGNGLADAAVYAIPASGGFDARPGKPTIAIEQIDREFVPYVTVVQTGTTVTFPNRDPILHHVYSFSPAKPFEIKLYSGKSPVEVVFDKAGIVALGCNIHDWMIGYVAVVPTPYFAKTSASGAARLRDLPAGAYEVRVWHPQQRTALEPRRITIDAAGATVPLEFTLDAAPRKPKYKPPLDRLRY